MTTAETLVVFAGSFLAGGLGAILGLGGGVFIVPLLSLWVGVPIHEAAGTSLVCVLATSAAGSVALDRTRLADTRLVTFLSLATVIGAILGAQLAPHVPARVVSGLFGVVTALSGYRLLRRALVTAPTPAPPAPVAPDAPPAPPPPPAPAAAGFTALPIGLTGCVGAGVLSGLLGIGGAPVKVPLMTEVMRIPVPVAFATSNMMVGITAAASTAAYYGNGLIRVDVVAPCALASALGAFVGGRIAPRLPVRPLLGVFVVVLAYLTGRMLWKAIS